MIIGFNVLSISQKGNIILAKRKRLLIGVNFPNNFNRNPKDFFKAATTQMIMSMNTLEKLLESYPRITKFVLELIALLIAVNKGK